MKKSFKINVIIILSTLTFMVSTGCKKFVQVPPPTTMLVTSDVFNNSSTATAALLNIYVNIYSNSESFNMALETGLLGDELTNYSTIFQNEQYYTNAMTAGLQDFFGPWTTAYNYVYQANAIIEGLQDNSAVDSKIENQLIGESKFIRAFWYFYLTNCYGSVPLITTTNYVVNASMTRASTQQVYRQIVDDLLDAQNLLNTNFVDATDTSITSDRTRPTTWAATAFLARTYLYLNKYDSAEMEASLVIANRSTFSLVANLDSVFLMNSQEAIWQLGIPLPAYQNTPDGTGFILFGMPTTCAISPQLLNAFEANDQRRYLWIDSITTTGPVDTFYYPNKYKVSDASPNATVISEYGMMFRLAEQYLIRAEAEANLGDMVDAARDLNTIRARAGLGPSPTLTASSNLQQADSAILHERQVELFTEWGNRWFDLIRTANVNSVLGAPGNVCQYKGGTWNSEYTLFPIPESDRFADPNLSQNPGYGN